MVKTLLCIPPRYDRSFPPLGTPALAGFLKSRGAPVEQADYNLRYHRFLAELFPSVPEHGIQEHMNGLFEKKASGFYYSHLAPAEDALALPYLPYGDNSATSYAFAENMLASPLLGRYLRDADENLCLRFFLEKGIVREIERAGVGLLGISLIAPSQVLAGLSLARLVKESCPGIRVAIGGPWVSLYREELKRRTDLTEFLDAMIVFEGETALWRLVESLSAGKEPAGVPNLVFSRGDAWADTGLAHEERMDDLPCPDFDGLPLLEYSFAQGDRPTLTFETSRGCYWGKCDFCVDLPLPKPTYRAKSAELAARDAKELVSRYGAGSLWFSDPALAPRQMREVSEALLREKVGVSWWSMARLDKALTPDILGLAAKAGCFRLNFGFESASDRVCGAFHKGNRREVSLEIMKACQDAGLGVGLQVMLGLPAETLEEGLETVDFLLAHRDMIETVGFNVYYLTPGNAIYDDPAAHGISFDRDPGRPFRFFTPFRQAPGGMTGRQANDLIRAYTALAARAEPARTSP